MNQEPELPGDDGLLPLQEDYWDEQGDGTARHRMEEDDKMKDLFAIFIVWTALLAGGAAADVAAIKLSVRRQVWRQPQAPCIRPAVPPCGRTLREWASAPAEVPTCQK